MKTTKLTIYICVKEKCKAMSIVSSDTNLNLLQIKLREFYNTEKPWFYFPNWRVL